MSDFKIPSFNPETDIAETTDGLGQTIRIGDIVIYPASWSRSSILKLGYVKRIRDRDNSGKPYRSNIHKMHLCALAENVWHDDRFVPVHHYGGVGRDSITEAWRCVIYPMMTLEMAAQKFDIKLDD